MAWPGAGVSPDGPAPSPPQTVCPSGQHLLGQNRGEGGLAGQDSLRFLRAGPPAPRRQGMGAASVLVPHPRDPPLLQSSPCPPPGPPSSSAHRGSGPGRRRLGWSWEEMGVLGADGAAGSWEPGVFGAGVTCSAGLCPRALGLQPLQEVGGQRCPGRGQRAHLSLGLLCPLLHGAPGQEGNPDSFPHVGVSVSGHETRETPCMSACDLTLRVFVPDFQT